MGENKDTLSFLVKHANYIAYIPAFAAAGAFAWYKLNQEPRNLQTLPIILIGTGTYALSVALSLLTYKLFQKDYPKISSNDLRKIKNEIAKKEKPLILYNSEKEVNYSWEDYSRLFFAKNHNELQTAAKKEHNPLLALDAIIKNTGQNKDFTENFIHIRDASDWMGGKKPKLSFSTRLSLFNHKFAFSLAQFFSPPSTELFLIYAFYSSILQPERAHYWSDLARQVAKKTNQYVQESYLIHALIATAQKRSDEWQAWDDVLTYCDLDSQRDYIGESQNPVWTIGRKDFFKSTIILKGDLKKENLELEFKGAQTLEKILTTAKPPTPLFISTIPIQGNYVYIMRTAAGETLHSRLEMGEKEGIEKIEDALAQIHARYPTRDLKTLDLEQKIRKKTEDLKLLPDFQNDLINATAPVRKAITRTGTISAAKDAHPENWILPDVYALDTLIKEKQPTCLDLANLYNYGEHFSPEEKRARAANYNERFSYWSAQESKPLQTLLLEYWNAEIQRAIDLSAAWMNPFRKGRHKHIRPLLERAQLAIHNLQQDDRAYFEENKAEYLKLHKLLDALKEHTTQTIQHTL